jgi:tetratricopeptide (TPR) repeat protein
MSPAVFAQKALLQKANRSYEKLDYQTAIELYLELLDRRDNSEAKMKLADCYRRVGNINESEYWYGQVVRLPESKPIHKLYYGMALQSNGKCDLAKPWLEQYSKDVPEDIRGTMIARSCDAIVISEHLEAGAFYQAEPVKTVNSIYDDFGAVMYNDGVVFTSSRDKGSIMKIKDQWMGQPFLDMYFSKTIQIEGDKLSYKHYTPETFSSFLNTRLHDGPAIFSRDGKEVFFTRNNLIHGKTGRDDEGIVRLKTFSSKQEKDGSWGDVKGMPFNSD